MPECQKRTNSSHSSAMGVKAVNWARGTHMPAARGGGGPRHLRHHTRKAMRDTADDSHRETLSLAKDNKWQVQIASVHQRDAFSRTIARPCSQRG